VNIAGRVDGVQFGLVNLAEHMDGLPIGLFSLAGNTKLQPLAWVTGHPRFNLGLKMTTGMAYQILSSARSMRPSACTGEAPPVAKRSRGCTGPSLGQGQPPKRVRW
jgi:hypothetical protein